MDVAFVKRNKVQLKDYDSEKDIAFRLALSSLSSLEVEILEEILFNPSTIPLVKLSRSLEIPLEILKTHLAKFSCLDCDLKEDSLYVGKETKRYLEIEIERFKEDFYPDLSFFQALLKKVPIHILPSWYSIPRTSSHITFSIIENYVSFPNLYERHLAEIKNTPLINKTLSLLFSEPTKKLKVETLNSHLQISSEELESLFIQLEFYFSAFISYEKTEEGFCRVLRPLKEWEDYLLFFQKKKESSVELPSPLVQNFVCDLKKALLFFQNASFSEEDFETKVPLTVTLPLYEETVYKKRLLQKAKEASLIVEKGALFSLSELGRKWLESKEKDQALFLYRQGGIGSDRENFSDIKELEKSFSNFPKKGWVSLETFYKNGLVCLGEETKVRLKKEGKYWCYDFPKYTEEEKQYLEKLLTECFFEGGLILLSYQEKTLYFRLTELGEMLFFE